MGNPSLDDVAIDVGPSASRPGRRRLNVTSTSSRWSRVTANNVSISKDTFPERDGWTFSSHSKAGGMSNGVRGIARSNVIGALFSTADSANPSASANVSERLGSGGFSCAYSLRRGRGL